MPHKDKHLASNDPDVKRLTDANGKAWHSYGVRTGTTIGMENPGAMRIQIWLDEHDATGKPECSTHSQAVLAEWFPEIDKEENELADSFYVTFQPLDERLGSQEVGHLTVGRRSFRVLPHHTDIRLSQENRRTVIEDLKNNIVVGTVGQWAWKEGRIPGE